MGKHFSKILIIAVIAAALLGFFVFDLGSVLTLENLKANQTKLYQFYYQNPVLMIGSYFLIYVVSVAISIPGAAVLTLAGGAVFGVFAGTVIVSFASTIGATLAFLVARFLLRDSFQEKFSAKLKTINEGMEKEGAFYLFSLRLIPAFPFWLINILMGLTPIRTTTFFFVSQIGMLAGTVAYVNAGTQLAQIDSLRGILSPGIILSFVILGLLPLASKKIVNYMRSRKFTKNYKKPGKFDYNLVVIGAGSGGLVSAYIASTVKAKVALIEKNKMGGDCLNTGCVPSKALIRSAKILSYINRSKDFGIKNANANFEFIDIMNRVKSVIQKIEPHDSVERYTKLGVDCIQGTATIKSPYEVEVDGKVITTKNIIVASGGEPMVPPIKGLDQIKYLTSDNIWDLKELPKRLVVLGGGPIGSELTQSFARLGSNVTQVEMADRIMNREDDEVADFVMAKFKKEGVNVLTKHKAKEFTVENGEKFLICEANGQDVKIPFDEVLIALGRRARTKGFGLDDLNIEITKRGTIAADPFLRTNYPNIYVVGDVVGPYQFTHFAAHQAWFATVNALFSPLVKFKADYRVIPWSTFTDPEVARVGLNEKEAKEQKVPYESTTYEINDLDRAIADAEDHGIVKVLTVPGKDKILGVTIMGSHAGDIIAEYVTAIKYNLGLNKILGTIHIYPTLAEANKYAAGNWKKAHKPEGILNFLGKFHTWRRG